MAMGVRLRCFLCFFDARQMIYASACFFKKGVIENPLLVVFFSGCWGTRMKYNG
jgi:hypothetical protein